MDKNKGKIVIISGPSGVGKDAVSKKVLESVDELEKVVTCTIRKIRPGEEDGEDYYFLTEEEFKRRMERGELLEYEFFSGNYYGAPKSELKRIDDLGKVPFFEIEVKGALNLRQMMGKENTLLIFILPESQEQLVKRIEKRNQNMNRDALRKRMETAKKEIGISKKYDVRIVNKEGRLDEAAKEVEEAVLDFLNKKPDRKSGRISFLKKLFSRS